MLERPSTTPVAALMDPAMPLRDGDPTVVEGWGTMTQGIRDSPDDLQAVQVPIVGFAKCKATYAELAGDRLCAGFDAGGKDSCQGDSGGPIAVRDAAGAWRQIGIVSYGAGCAAAGKPGIYAHVGSAPIRGFIDANVAALAGQPAPAPGQPGPVAAPADATAPALSMTMTPAIVPVGGITTARFTLDEAATIKIAVLRKVRRGGRVRLVRLPGLIERRAGAGSASCASARGRSSAARRTTSRSRRSTRQEIARRSSERSSGHLSRCFDDPGSGVGEEGRCAGRQLATDGPCGDRADRRRPCAARLRRGPSRRVGHLAGRAGT